MRLNQTLLSTNGRYRRVLPVAVCPAKGPVLWRKSLRALRWSVERLGNPAFAATIEAVCSLLTASTWEVRLIRRQEGRLAQATIDTLAVSAAIAWTMGKGSALLV